jgi:hypothetical protein
VCRARIHVHVVIPVSGSFLNFQHFEKSY